MKTIYVTTPVVKQAYELTGPDHGEPLFLLHGWPDSPRTWDKMLPLLHDASFRTIAPYLRGYGPSRFRSRMFGASPRRSGQPVAFAQDMMNIADRLKLRRFHFIGHDWGARTGYALAALFPKRLKSFVAISVPFEPGQAKAPAFPQAYQWLLCTKPGETKFREDPTAFGRAQWDAWSPASWYTPAEFEKASESWQGKDFEEVVLHSYRSRWGHAEMDPRYGTLQQRFESTEYLHVPTLLLHGLEDHCELKATTDGAGRWFSGDYSRTLLDGVGHFPQRETPDKVAEAILNHLRDHYQ